jgi:hypothetical protein
VRNAAAPAGRTGIIPTIRAAWLTEVSERRKTEIKRVKGFHYRRDEEKSPFAKLERWTMWHKQRSEDKHRE